MMTDALDRTEDDCEAITDDAGPPDSWPEWTDDVRYSARPACDDLPPADPELDRLARRFVELEAATWALDVVEPTPTQDEYDGVADVHDLALVALVDAMDARGLAWCRGGDHLVFMHPLSNLALMVVPVAPQGRPAPRPNLAIFDRCESSHIATVPPPRSNPDDVTPPRSVEDLELDRLAVAYLRAERESLSGDWASRDEGTFAESLRLCEAMKAANRELVAAMHARRTWWVRAGDRMVFLDPSDYATALHVPAEAGPLAPAECPRDSPYLGEGPT